MKPDDFVTLKATARTLMLLRNVKAAYQKELERGMIVSPNNLKTCLEFLVEHKLVQFTENPKGKMPLGFYTLTKSGARLAEHMTRCQEMLVGFCDQK